MRLENIVSVKFKQVLVFFFREKNLKLTQSNVDNMRGTDLAIELENKLKRLGHKSIFPQRQPVKLFGK